MIYKLNGREAEIAAKFISSYLHLHKTVTKVDEEGEEIAEDDRINMIYAIIRSADTIKKIRFTLNMSVPVFRNYVSAMKAKGFFSAGGKFNKDFVPTGSISTIEIQFNEFV
ncbi:MAG: hypothetical protein KAH32_04870 [Chlamydiia bacterium]|nr:hypothetical protein [Chlamydiia bacterium]